MPTIKKILVPTDLSELSAVGVHYALEMAESQGAEVIVLYVAHYKDVARHRGYEASLQVHYETVGELLDGCKKGVAEFLQKRFSDLMQKVKVQEEADFGEAYESIVEKAEAEGVDMIIMSTHGRTGVGHMLIGSVTEQVVRRARCPVLSVRSSK